MSSHTALEYFSQPLSELIYQPLPSQPFCLFCDEAKLNRLLCEREMVSNTKNKMKGVRMPLMSMIGEEEFMVRFFDTFNCNQQTSPHLHLLLYVDPNDVFVHQSE